jgi:hypothetical protein
LFWLLSVEVVEEGLRVEAGLALNFSFHVS